VKKHEQPPILTEEDEAILDRIWASLGDDDTDDTPDEEVTRAAGAIETHDAGGKAAGGHWVTMDGSPVFIPAGAVQGQPSTGQNPTHPTTDAEPAEPAQATRPGFRTATDADRKALTLPPAWRNVMVAEDPQADLIAIGTDAKGRTQYRYSTAHSARQAAAKFSRLKAFHEALPKLLPRIEQDKSKNDAAAVLALIAKTGFRVGSTTDTKAEEQAYGASTLTKDHVRVEGDTVNFSFTGKKGVPIKKTVKDPDLAALMTERLGKEGHHLFKASDAQVRDYLHKIDGEFKVKDFRTWQGTSVAKHVVDQMPVPKDLSEFDKARKQVAKVVADHLGNTPDVALDAYIDPAVFSAWVSFGAHKTERAESVVGRDLGATMDELFETVSFDAPVSDHFADTDDVPEDDSPHASQRELGTKERFAHTHVQDAAAHLSLWEAKVKRRIADGRAPTAPFTSDQIPEDVAEFVRHGLVAVQSPDDAKALFADAKQRARPYAVLPGGVPHERKSFGRLWQARRLARERDTL
jgi:DNA topoisomerase I